MKVAVLGYGTVGKGVCEMVEAAPGLELGPVFVRKGKETEPNMVSDLSVILSDKSVKAVAEAMGGIEFPYECAKQILSSGKHFITANKALVEAKGIELAGIARKHKVGFMFSAACCGGVPFLHNLQEAALTDSVESLGGIMNGTTNYMLDHMQRDGLTFEQALKNAQDLGYAEKDPTDDLNGLDAQRKIALGCAVAFKKLPKESICREGIENFTDRDVRSIQEMGKVCRLVTKGAKTENGVCMFIEPRLFPVLSPECSVVENLNYASYTAANVGVIRMIGQGAGRYPTASALLRDMERIECKHNLMMDPECEEIAADNDSVLQRYYVRTEVTYEYLVPYFEWSVKEGLVTGITNPISVSEMHSMAKEIRNEGAEVFFASIEE